jgi:hypothetical protein
MGRCFSLIWHSPRTKVPKSSLRISAIVSCWVLLASLCFGARKDDTNLKSLYDRHQWFELRDSVSKGGASAFYQGAVACAFNDLRGCERRVRDVFNTASRSDEVVEAHRILASRLFHPR